MTTHDMTTHDMTTRIVALSRNEWSLP